VRKEDVLRVRVFLVLAAILVVCAGYWFSPPLDGVKFSDLTTQAEEFYAAGSYQESLKAYQRAESRALEDGEARAALSSRAQRGVCLKMLERNDEARSLMESVLIAAREMEDARIEGLALGNLARIESLEGRVDESLDYMNQLVSFSMAHNDARTEILTREQTAVFLERVGRYEEALAAFNEALERHGQLDLGEDDRRDALLRQKGWTLLRLGDDFGASLVWAEAAPAPTTLARRAQQLSMLGLHTEAAETALAASLLFEEETPRRDDARDEALALSLSELLLSGQLEACQKELDALLAQDGDVVSRAPLELVYARLDLTEGRFEVAAVRARAARLGFEDSPRAQEAGWIETVALLGAGDQEQALAVLKGLPDSLAHTVLYGWILTKAPDRKRLSSELLPLLDAERCSGKDLSVSALRRLCPVPLPSLAWLSLHLALVDADQLRERKLDSVADAVLSAGISGALRWQAIETLERLTGRWSGSMRLDNSSRVDGWLDGQLASDEAVIAVVPGLNASYLVVLTSGQGGAVFGLPSADILHASTLAVVETLRSGRLTDVAQAAHSLFAQLFNTPALEDLAGRTRWWLLLPDELTSVPPAMWVTQPPVPNAPVAWLIRDHELSLMPLVLSEGLMPQKAVGGHPEGEGAAASSRFGGSDWVRLGEPAIDQGALAWAAAFAQGTYGDSALNPGTLRDSKAPVYSRAECTVAVALEHLESADVVELSLPGFGGGRLAGLLFAPDPGISRVDAAAGFLSWRRIAESELSADVILDRTRFDPSSTQYGAALAASAWLVAGVQQVLMTRWPLPEPVRDSMIGLVERGADGSRSLAQLIGEAQRFFLNGAEKAGIIDRTYPLFWAGWLPFDAGP
jgi:tetratricopeptide (TPR) repeat protein